MMSVENLTERMGNAHLNDEQLPFNPGPEMGIPQDALEHIPRYLFRIVSPHSNGYTDSTWVHSQAAADNIPSSREDIFLNLGRDKQEAVALTLLFHLRWWSKDDMADNFVSWTSSLLFALQYIYYRHWSNRDGSDLKDIKLFVVDTTLFPRGTFMRDIDLINAFSPVADDYTRRELELVQGWRTGGPNYFGEYLSQGLLKIEDKYQVIPASVLIDGDRLWRLQPAFKNIHSHAQASMDRPSWPKEVTRIRGVLRGNGRPSIQFTEEGMRERVMALEPIIDSFEPAWRRPMAIFFIALMGCESEIPSPGIETDILYQFLKRAGLLEKPGLRLAQFQLDASDVMVESRRAEQVLLQVYKYGQLCKNLKIAQQAASKVQRLLVRHNIYHREDGSAAAGGNETLASGHQRVLDTLDSIRALCDQASEVYSVAHEGE
ncbi:hypothetical protein BJX70DRAFT_381438 [Aspergillus crustosus]